MKGIKITAYKLIHLLNNRKGEAMYSFYKSIAKSQKIPFSNGLRVIVTLLLVGLLSSSTALGQTYPVQANLSITTPCPNRLSSLFPMGSSRVTLSLFLRDAMQQDVQAKLRFTIEGQGIKLETSPSYLPTPFHLQGGVPIVLRTELEPYFNPNNLMVTGASAGTFIQNRVLPEGVYTFTVEVIEARRQVVISNKAQTILLVMENEAPTLISPQPNSVAEPNPVQNLFISWISPIVITPSLGIPINYELSIWDAPQGTDPNLAIRSLRPKETVETTRTNFVWNATNTELVVGNWYILAVKAIDPSGELSFKNNGLSQPVMFRYGTPCLPPINPTHSDITQKGAKIAWTPIGGASQFLVEIKPKADKNDTWSELNANKSTLEVTTMLPSKAYVYRVSSVCGFMQSAPTREAELTTLPMPEQRGECTGNLSIPPVDDQTPLNALTPGSIILASGFMVTVDEVTNTEGTKFSGTGRATFPLFGFTLRVEFKNIQVNNLLQLLSGKIVALKNDDVTFLNNQPNTNNNTFDYSNPQDTLIIPEVIDTVYQNDNGDWVVVSTDSTEVVVEPDPTGTLIIDSTGGGVVVGPGGYQPYNPGTGGNNPTGSNGDLPNKLASKRVTFTKGGYQHRNGFEPVNKNMPSNYYQSITIGDSTLLLPWKSVGTTGQDKLFATPVEDPAHTFAFQNGSAVSANAEGTSYGVWVTPPPAGEDNLLALAGADTSLAGAIRVKAYSPIRRVLKVVPVGGNKPMFSAASLQTELNRIYAQALTEWEVSFTQPLQSTNWDVAPLNFVEIPKTDYSTEMRAIWQAFLAEQTYDRNAVYLFVVTGFNKADTRGYMPLRSGYGFISTAATARDAAHELGHGVFNLRHTFSPYNRYQLPESTTSNLMDYKNGTDLLKYQWDYIHDPEGGLFLFEDSEEGEVVVENSTKALARLIKTINCAHNNKKQKVKLYLPSTSIKASIAGLESELYVTGSLCAKDAELKATLYEMFGEAKDFGNDYLEDVFNLEDIAFDDNNKIITLKGDKYTLLFSGTKEAECAYRFTKSNLIGSLHVPRTPINYATLDQLQYSSPCELQYLSIDSRKDLLQKIQSETNWYNGSLKDSRQKITINVIATTPKKDRGSLISFFSSNTALLKTLYDRLDDYRGEFIEELNNVYQDGLGCLSRNKVVALGLQPGVMEQDMPWYEDLSFMWGYLYTIKKHTYAEYVSADKISVYIKEYRGISIGREALMADGQLLCEGSPFDVIKGVKLESGKQVDIPLFYFLYKAEEGETDAMYKDISALGEKSVDLALIVFGLKNLQGASSLLKAEVTAQNVARLLLGFGDLTTLGLGEICENGTSEFCQAYKEYEFYINMGLLSANILNEFPQLYKNLRKGLDDPALTKEQKDGLRKVLGEADEIPIRYNRASIASIKGFSDELSELLSKQGLTIDEFKVLQQKTFESMTAAEKVKINAIRNSIQTPNSETLLQKVIPKSDIDKYLDGTYKQVGGYVSTAKDAKHLKTYDDIYYGMRLDYKLGDGVSQNFYLSDGSCGVIRYKTPKANTLEVPKYPTVNDPPPFTGHGFTSGNNGRLAVPEWKSGYNTPDDGAELWEVYSNGTEVLRAVFSKVENKFISVK
ncbi:MAG: hypothetical protein JXR57_15365 [Bacteroidales bacterium]|nr:hypothetical protein [Bacteroidales bacterium]